MATKIIQSQKRRVGEVPFSSIVSTDKKGQYVAIAKIGQEEFSGSGDSPRLATIKLRQVVEKFNASEGKSKDVS